MCVHFFFFLLEIEETNRCLRIDPCGTPHGIWDHFHLFPGVYYHFFCTDRGACVVVVAGHSFAHFGAFAVTPHTRDRAGRADHAAALRVAITAAAAHGVRGRG